MIIFEKVDKNQFKLKNVDSDITCPFCKENDFDLIGLKHHLMNEYCEIFNNIQNI